MNTVTWMDAEVHTMGDKLTVTVFNGQDVVYQFETANGTGLVRRIDNHLKRRNYLRDSAYEFVGSSAYFRIAYLGKVNQAALSAMEVNA
jgi:hypothetical protein